MKTNFAPVGPTNRALIPLGSSVGVEMLDSLTVSLEMVPDIPATLMVEGYADAFCGVACVPLGTVIPAALVNEVWAREKVVVAA